MVELKYNGLPLPATIGSQVRYEFQTFLNGSEIIPAQWSVSAGATTVASGRSSRINFLPTLSQVHTITAKVPVEFGYSDISATVNVVPKTGRAKVGVSWSKLMYSPGEILNATIVAEDSNGQSAFKIEWSVTHNSNPLQSGVGGTVTIPATDDGVYRLTGTASCLDGSVLSFDNSAFVRGTVNLRSSVPEPDPGGTMVYLGDVYTNVMSCVPLTVFTAPYQMLSAGQEIILLPGSTHWCFDAVNTGEDTALPPEVVVRTKNGNWALNGYPDGLNSEDVGYDYQTGSPFVSAPSDLRMTFTVDAWIAHLDANQNPPRADQPAANFRVRIKCYRRTANVYKYRRCTYSNHPGGEGRRARRFAVLFTQLDVQTDALSGLNRLGTGNAVVPYSTPKVGNIPMMRLDTDGSPNPPLYKTGMFYTDSNTYAVYESENAPDIYAKAVAGIEGGLRHAYFSLMTFPNGEPLVVNRVKRLYGKLVLLATDGPVFQGEQFTLTVRKARSTFSQTLSVTAPATVYVNADDTFAKVAEMDVDISDFQFDETGVLIGIAVHGGVTSTPPSNTDLVVSPEFIYSRQYTASASFDGACYSDPQYVPVYDSDAGGGISAIIGCHDKACGPTGIYCYTPLYGTGSNVLTTQPYGFPAPYLAFAFAPAVCYTPAGFVQDSTGTDIIGTQSMVAYQTGSLCGKAYRYLRCDSIYSTVAASNMEIVVVYPPAASPHSTVQYQSDCFFYSGTLTTLTSYGTRPVVSSGSVTARLGCSDYYCSGSVANGSVAVYYDSERRQQVPVRFDHFEVGIPNYAVAPEKFDDGTGGLTAGQRYLVFRIATNKLFTANGNGQVNVHTGLRGLRKRLSVIRSGSRTLYDVGTGDSRIISVQTGDIVSLELGDAYGALPPQFKNYTVTVSWEPVIVLPHLYDTVDVVYTSPVTIRALGFCGYTDQSSYSFYGTIPTTAAMSGAVNPDSAVTIVNGGTEYALLTVTGFADTNFERVNVRPYAGQSLTGASQFRFYACRTPAGVHGEMDVWYSSNGTLPTYLAANPYRTIERTGSTYYQTSSVADTTRNAYKVASTAYRLPRLFEGSDGEIVSVASGSNSINVNGKVFTLVGTDPGLSYTVLTEPPPVDTDYLTENNLGPWLTEDELDHWQME